MCGVRTTLYALAVIDLSSPSEEGHVIKYTRLLI